jgi:3-oxoacyl-(acyl-carrier-protein) synthase
MPDTAVAVAGLSVLSALGRGPEAHLAAALPGAAAFGEIERFDTSGRRVTVAATTAAVDSLAVELVVAVTTACAEAGLRRAERAATPLMLAVHGDEGAAVLARSVAAQAGTGAPMRIYTSACVSASTAIADAAALIRRGVVERIVVAAGYLVEPDQFALFDAGRALATDEVVRPFSAGRSGLLLGDGVAAVVLQAGEGLAEIAGWGRAGRCVPPVPAGSGRSRPGRGHRGGPAPGGAARVGRRLRQRERHRDELQRRLRGGGTGAGAR